MIQLFFCLHTDDIRQIAGTELAIFMERRRTNPLKTNAYTFTDITKKSAKRLS